MGVFRLAGVELILNGRNFWRASRGKRQGDFIGVGSCRGNFRLRTVWNRICGLIITNKIISEVSVSKGGTDR